MKFPKMIMKYPFLWFFLISGSLGTASNKVINDNFTASGCFDVLKIDFLFNSEGEGVQLKLTTTDESPEIEPEWVVALYRLSDLKHQHPYYTAVFMDEDNFHIYDSIEEFKSKADLQLNTDGEYLLTSLKGNNSIASMTFKRSGRYCYAARNRLKLKDGSRVKASIHLPNSSVLSRDWVDFYIGLLIFLICSLLIYPFISKWNNNSYSMKMPFRIKQVLYWYYIPVCVVIPLLRFVIPTILESFLGWENGLLLKLTVYCYIIVQNFNLRLDTLYLLLVSRGFDVLPRNTFPLNSKRYVVAWILYSFHFIDFVHWLALCYAVYQYFKTQRFLLSMSLKYPQRLKAVIHMEVLHCAFRLLYFVYLLIYMIAFEKQVETSRFSGARFVLKSVFEGTLIAIPLAYFLTSYWVPELIQEDQNESSPLDIEYELDNYKTI